MRTLLVLLVLFAACGPRGGAAPSSPARPPSAPDAHVPPPPQPGPATHVVVLAPQTPTAVLRGPFLVTTINPAGNLRLGIAAGESCDGVLWFSYSGGGVAAAAGELLCAWSTADDPVTQGFSGEGGP